MAEFTGRKCDIYGTVQGVQNYGISIVNEKGEPIIDESKDLSKRALTRLKKFIDRGLRPTNEEGDADTNETQTSTDHNVTDSGESE